MAWRLPIILLLVLGLSGCEGDEGSEGATDASSVDTAHDVQEGLPETLHEASSLDEAPDMVGTWALRTVMASISVAPIIGDIDSSTEAIQLVEITEDGAGLVATLTTCAVDIVDGTELVDTIFPDALLESLPVIATPVEVVAGDDGTYRYVQPITYDIRGAVLADPVSDALPSSPDDARVVDQDDDGNPGVTIRVTGILDGELYLVQRAWSSLEGGFTSLDTVEGLVTWGDEQALLASDNEVLMANQPESFPDPDASKSTFHFVRVDAGATCDQIVSQAATLFGQ